MLWISVAVFLVVAVMIVQAAVRGRKTEDEGLDRRNVRWGEPFVVIAGVFIPFLILAGTYIFSLNEMDALSAQSEGGDLTIEVIGHDWWWEVRYPNGAVSANEMHIPTDEPVEVELATADVIHSFWVPRLQVKTDQIPGQVNRTWLEASRAGVYRGQCAEFCGLQHANMVFYVIAQPPDEYDRWVEHAAQPATETEDEGEEIFLSSSCVGCHAIRGTDAEGQLGPDLTHFAERETFAGIIDNTPENLFDWIKNAQEIKPGVTMPPAELSDEEIEAVVDYLGDLR